MERALAAASARWGQQWGGRVTGTSIPQKKEAAVGQDLINKCTCKEMQAGRSINYRTWTLKLEVKRNHSSNNRVKVSAVRVAIRAVRNSQELCLYSGAFKCTQSGALTFLTICGYISAEDGWLKAKSLCVIMIYGMNYISYRSAGWRHCQ